MTATTRFAILTFDGFNELDSFIALGLLNRLKASGWSAISLCKQSWQHLICLTRLTG